MAPRSNSVLRRGFQALLLVSVLALAPETVEAQEVLPAPGGFAVSPQDLSVGVRWNAVSDADGYRIEWKSGSQSYDSSRRENVQGAQGGGILIADLTGGVEYTFRMQARRGSQGGIWTAEKTVRVFHSPLEKVRNLRVSGVAGNMEWRWNAVPNAEDYRFEWKGPGESYSSSRRLTYASTVTRVNDRVSGRFTPGLTYTFRVRAMRDFTSLPASWSDEVRLLVGAPTPLQVDPPTVMVQPGALEVSWSAREADVTTYLVQWKSGDQSYDESRQLTVPGTDTSATIENLVGGTEYSVHVIATRQHASANSPPSTEAMGTLTSGLAIGDTSAPEGERLTFTVTLSPASSNEVTVRYADTGTGSATAGTDYTLEAGTLTFAPGETSKTIAVNTVEDDVAEPDEAVVLTLRNPTGGARISIATSAGTGTITNDDSRITVPGASSPIIINGQTVTVTEDPAVSDVVSVESPASIEFPLTLDRHVSLTINPVASTVPVKSMRYGLGEASARTLLDIGVTPVPTGGVKICLPVKDDLRQEATGRQMLLLHYDGTNWQAVTGSREEDQQVCASGVTTFSPFAAGYRLSSYESRDGSLVLAGVARTLATDAVAVIGRRFGATPSTTSHVTLGGQTLTNTQQATNLAIGVARAFGVSLNTGGIGTSGGSSSSSLPPLCKGRLGGVESQGCPLAAGNQWTPGSGLGTQGSGLANITPVSVNNVLARSAFELPLSSTGDTGLPTWTLWGRGSASGFSGSPDADFNMDGTLYSGYVGVDYRPRSSLLFGLAVSHSQGQVDYERAGGQAEVDLQLTSVLPYAHWQPRPGLGVWGLFGAGLGTADYEGTGATPLAKRSADLTSLMGAIGGQQALTTWEGIDLSAKTDAFLSTMRTEEATDLPSARGNAQRIRLLLEGQKDIQVDAVSRLAPRLAFGGRWDNGTAEQGFGAEVNGGLAYTNTASGLSVEAQGRYLLAHEADEFDDWGASLNVRLDPGQMGQGASLTIAPVWGQAASGVNQLWDNTQMLGQVAGAAGSNTTQPGATSWMPQQLEVAMGYGLALPERQALLTPYGGLTLAGPGTSRYRLGSSLAMDSFLNLTLELTHTNQLAQSANQGIATRIDWQW